MPLEQEVLNKHVVKLNQDLENKDYNELFIDLRLFGFQHQKSFKALYNIEASLNNPEFRNFLFLTIKNLNQETLTTSSKILICFRRVLMTWDDTSLERKGENQKRKRQLLKFKGLLDKNDRTAIRIGLYALTLYLTQTQQANNLITTQNLINLVSKLIKNTELPKATEDKLEVEKIGLAISSFLTPNKIKKSIKYSGIFIAFIASLACGLATGGAIFLVFPSLPILGIVLGSLIGLFGFSANFGFFSQNFPNFLLSFLKKGGISEYIDAEGKRQQLSRLKKYLFIPLALLASLTVGIGTVAITYSTVLALAAKLLPILALIWPPLPLIIVGILSAAIGITLTVAVLTATIEAIKNSQEWSWESIKDTFKNLTKLQILGYVAKGLLVLVGLFGLAYYRYTAGLDLYNLIIPLVGSKPALIAAFIMGAFAYIPQAFFTIFSMQKLFRLFFSSSVHQEDTSDHARFSRIKSIANSIYKLIYLIGNALGNAALVIVDSISAWSISGAIGCFVNSWSGNIVEKDPHQYSRNQATEALVNEKITKAASAATSHFDSDKVSFNHPLVSLNYLPEPKPTASDNPSSPASSENGLVINMSSNYDEVELLHEPSFFKQSVADNNTEKSNNQISNVNLTNTLLY